MFFIFLFYFSSILVILIGIFSANVQLFSNKMVYVKFILLFLVFNMYHIYSLRNEVNKANPVFIMPGEDF